MADIGTVPGDLHLHVARTWQQLLDIERWVTECGRSLGGAPLVGRGQLLGREDGPGAAPAAAVHGLDHHGGTGAERGEELLRFLQARRPVGAGQDRDAGTARKCPRLGLVPEEIKRLRGWADEDKSLAGAGPGKGRV